MFWGDSLIHLSHLPPDAPAYVGDDRAGAVACVLPMARRRVERGVHREGALTIEAQPCALEVPPSRPGASFSLVAPFLASALLHGAFFGALSLQPPATLDFEEDPVSREHARKLSMAAGSRPRDERASNQPGPTSASGDDLGAAHRGSSGVLGRSTAHAPAHFAIKGPPDTKEAKLARTRMLIDSARYGAIGALAEVLPGVGPFHGDEDVNLGSDEKTAYGNFFGPRAGEAFGSNGLGLSGNGDGGGSAYGGIGIGISGLFGMGGYGHGSGTGGGLGYGTGGSGGTCGRPTPAPCSRRTRTVRLIEVGDDIRGSLPPDAVKRVVQANFPRFRACYESGLRKDPSLAGTVSVRFIIDGTGAVETASASGGSLTESSVRDCVTSVYRTLSFPEPPSGKVLVTYPIDFQPE